MANKTVEKKRAWAFVLYPDSAVPDWRDRLVQSGLKIAISPLHDKDINIGEASEVPEPKKPHYHIMVVYDGPTTMRNVRRFADKLRSDVASDLEPTSYVIDLDSVRGMYRYLTHEDNPEKYHYDSKDIVTLNGFYIEDFTSFTASEVDAILDFIDDFIKEHYITDYGVLIYRLGDLDNKNYKKIARSHTLHCKAMCATMRHGIKRDEEGNLIVVTTGETL